MATVPGFPAWAGAGSANLLCFVGSWLFTAAAGMQLALASRTHRLEWGAAAVQFAGTLLFNVSTGAAVWVHAVRPERDDVWVPDATGSLFFLISGVLAVGAVGAAAGHDLRSPDWGAAVINLTGCVAFAVSAVAAFVRADGVTADERLANLGTFVGALCFLTAALIALPPPRSRRVVPGSSG